MDAIVTAPAGLHAYFQSAQGVKRMPVVAVKVDDAAQSDGSVYVVEGSKVRALESTRLWADASHGSIEDEPSSFLGVFSAMDPHGIEPSAS